MISSINLTIFILWFLSALIDYAGFCYIWQLKEYRMDRFKDFLASSQARPLLVSYSIFWRSVLAMVAFLWPINDVLIIKYIAVLIFSFDLIHNLTKKILGKLTRPVLTKKSILIIWSAMLFEGGLFVLTRDWAVLIFLTIIRFFIISLVVYLFYWPTVGLKKWYIKKATQKLARYKDLTVVGITGSYAKTSVKEFLSHILSTKLNVIKTPRNTNTEIGIAKFILRSKFDNKQVFVVEMGAYNMGEIKLICDMVKPKIGILTAISPQHLSLFGSIENIQKAKYELLRSLPEDGYAITNRDNKYCIEFLDELKCKHISTFGTEKERDADCTITEIKPTEGGTIFGGIVRDLSGELIEGSLNTPVIGAHHAYNIAPTILVAFYFHMTKEEIIKACSTLPRDIHGSVKIRQYGKAIIIDDSYNSNPDGFRAALDIMTNYSSEKRRIVITRGMEELGERSKELHESIGGEIAFVADKLILIKPDHKEDVKRGVVDKYRLEVEVIEDHKKLLEFLRSQKDKDVIILLENRMPFLIYSEITASAE